MDHYFPWHGERGNGRWLLDTHCNHASHWRMQRIIISYKYARPSHSYTIFPSTRYPLLLGRQGKHGMRILPSTFTHDQQWESSPDLLLFHSTSHPQSCMLPRLTLKVLVATIDAQWEGMGDVGSARYEPALLPPCPTIRVLSYSN